MNSPGDTEHPKTTGGRAHRLAAADLAMAEEVFKAAMFLMSPDDYKQRQAFKNLMPYLFVLQSNGWSWKQLTKLLNDCGFKLAASTVRRYFEEFKKLNLETCLQAMNEHILLRKEVAIQTEGMNFSAIPGRVADILNGFYL